MADNDDDWREVRAAASKPTTPDDAKWVDDLTDAPPTAPGHTTAIFIKTPQSTES